MTGQTESGISLTDEWGKLNSEYHLKEEDKEREKNNHRKANTNSKAINQ